jgi:hypothetical protein
MLKWSTKPDPVFFDIVSNSLQYYQAYFKDNEIDETYNVFKIFGKKGLAIEVEKILTAHHSEKIYCVTDYHFLILYEALNLYCDLYKEGFFEDTLLGGIHPSELDFEDMVGIYFHDTDFLFESETINNLSVGQKDEMSISSDVFSIANNLTPHADELIISEADELEPNDQILFKDGKPYPFFDDIDS